MIPETPPPADWTEDAFLDGAFRVLQPRRGGHRAGLDALLLAAAVPASASGRLVDLGAGVGVAGLAAATRAQGLRVTLVERDPLTAELARRGLDLPVNAALAARAEVIEADVTAPERARLAAGLEPGCADWVIANPPFHPERGSRASPHARRGAAHVLPEGDLDLWIRYALWLLKPKGRLALIFRADGIAEVLGCLDRRFGQTTIHPIFPRPDAPALRIVVTAIKASRAGQAIMAGLVLHGEGGSGEYLPEAEAVLRGRIGFASDRV